MVRVLQSTVKTRVKGQDFSVRHTEDSENIKQCQQLLATVFHKELDLVGMSIPDPYDQYSLYMELLDLEEVLVGTYRIVLPNNSVGLPIEETGFDLGLCAPGKICEMSRLAILKSSRGKIPFNRIIQSACEMAIEQNASTLVAALLPQNVRLFRRYGFKQISEPIHDPTVETDNPDESVVVPMQIVL